MKKILLLAVSFFALTGAAAPHEEAAAGDTCEVVRPVMSAYTLDAGSSHLADTYLSPLKFSGFHVGFSYERMQAMRFSPEKWVMQMKFGVSADRATAPRGMALWNGQIDFSWGMMHRWRVMDNLTLAVGGNAALDLGAVYNSRNGNNPVSAKASLMLGATGYAAWKVKIGRLPITLRYQPTLPVIGAFFAPAYGELYYEIYLGNHSGLAHCAWWGNYLQSSHLVTADFHFGATALRIGYDGRFLSTKINDIVTHIYSHAFVFGISGEWISLNPRKGVSKRAKIISATL